MSQERFSGETAAAVQEGVEYEPATIGARFGARVIDLVVLIIAMFVCLSLVIMSLAGGDVRPERLGVVPHIIGWAVSGFYEVGCVWLAGATFGKWCLGMKVVRAGSGTRVGFVGALVRWLLPVLGGLLVIGGVVVWLSALWDRSGRRRGWHDLAAKAEVISTRRRGAPAGAWASGSRVDGLGYGP